MRSEGNSGCIIIVQSTRYNPLGEQSECEHICWDPKDGELCLSRVNLGETLVEAHRVSDV